MLGRRQLIAVFIALLSAMAGAQTAGTPVRQAQTGKTTGSLSATAAAAVNCGGTSCVTVSTIGYAVATVTVQGTYSGATLNFEFSVDGGTTYFATQCSETNAAVQESSKAPGTNASMAWDCGVFAATNFEVRQSAISTGTAVVNVSLSAAAIEPALNVAGTFWQATQPISVADGLDVTLGAKADAKSTATDTTPITVMQVLKQISASAQAPPSQAVTNATSSSFLADVNYKSMAGSTVVADPCKVNAKTFTVINVASTSAVKLVTLASAKITYVCSINLVTASANNIALISGTKVTTECDTTTAGMNGGTTAATGWNFAANGGIVIGNGDSTVLAAASAKDLCILDSGAGQVSGTIVWVQQ